MAREEDTQIGKWLYKEIGTREPIMYLTAKLRIPSSKKWTDEVDLFVDTGYDGEILLVEDLFLLAGYHQFLFSEDQWMVSETVTGEKLKMLRTNTLMLVKNIEIDVIVETHSQIQENILGRGFLNRYIALLNGKKSEFELYE